MNEAARPSELDIASGPARGGQRQTWPAAVIAGMALSAVFGVLLSYASFLPALLGLFFNILFGLIVGAITFRIAHSGRPLSRGAVYVGTGLIVLTSWCVSLYWEADSFPRTVSRMAIEKTPRLADGVTKAQFRDEVRQAAVAILATEYPPGGALGYFRWIFASGRLEKGAITNVPVEVKLSQRGWVWLIRVVLALVLTAFGVGSQTMALAPRVRDVGPGDEGGARA